MLKKNQKIQLEKDSYTLIELIGEGGQGVIWKVEAESTGNNYVLKTSRTHEVTPQGRFQPIDRCLVDNLSRRMQEEINFFLSVQSNLSKQRACFIATCLDHGTIDDESLVLPVMIMRHYPQTLQEQVPHSLEQPPHYNLHTLLNWLIQLSHALQCTHEQIVDGYAYMHRDIKPANVLLTETGEVRLIDFGIAKQQTDDSGTTSVAHAPAWAAPEQVLPQGLREDGENIFRLTEKTDLYSLGLLAYYLCSSGAKTSSQTELSQRSQAIYSKHIVSLGKGGSGLLGKVGGMSKKDKDYLRQQLLTLFFNNSSRSDGSSNSNSSDNIDIKPLPSSELISNQLVEFIEKLLSPDSQKRPKAKVAKQYFRSLQKCLSPQLKTLGVLVVNRKLILGEPLELKIKIKSLGLTYPLDWIKIYISNQHIPSFEILSIIPQNSTFLEKETELHLRLNAIDNTGEHSISIIAAVGDKKHEATENCKVEFSAEQLWQESFHKAALKKELKKEWLDKLEEKAQGSIKERYQYLELLEDLSKSSKLNNKEKNNLIRRYQRAEVIKPSTKIPKLLIVVIFCIVIFILDLLLWSSYITEYFKVLLKPFESPQMVTIPEGSFKMGCLNKKDCNHDEAPIHAVNIKKFFMSSTEITFEQWNICVEDRACSYQPKSTDKNGKESKHPVINVSWNDTQEYTRWLSQKTGNTYRLPTEAEWEYAARAGSRTKYSWGNQSPHCSKISPHGASHNGGEDSSCYYIASNKDRGTEVVASYKANAWGLYDMHGNVWEWTCSAYIEKYNGAENQCIDVNSDTSLVVLRGGSWLYPAKRLRSASRVSSPSHRQSKDIGFRIVKVP